MSLERLQVCANFVAVVTVVAVGPCGCEFVTDDAASGSAVAADDFVPDCDDPIRAGARATDAYDCQILESAAEAHEPDPMVFKAQISLESNFGLYAISPDSPCGENRQPGWTVAETKSFGLMQLTPACGWLPDARLPDGHPNLAHEDDSALWPTSVFNPKMNITEGVRAIVVNRASVKQHFPGCSDNDYTLMALGAFNQGENAISGCGLTMMASNAQTYVRTVLAKYLDMAGRAHWPNRY